MYKFELGQIVRDLKDGREGAIKRRMNEQEVTDDMVRTVNIYAFGDLTMMVKEESLELVVPKKMFHLYVDPSNGCIVDTMYCEEGFSVRGSRRSSIDKLIKTGFSVELPYKEPRSKMSKEPRSKMSKKPVVVEEEEEEEEDWD